MTTENTSAPTTVVATKRKVYVQNGEVMAYAVTKCRTCYGTGQHRYIKPNGERVTKVCDKAFKRFVKANPDVIFDPKEGSFYREVEDVEVVEKTPEFVEAVSVPSCSIVGEPAPVGTVTVTAPEEKAA